MESQGSLLDKGLLSLLAFKTSFLSHGLRSRCMQVKINGKSEEVQGATVLDLLKAKNIDPHMVAVELNNTMLERDHLGNTHVKDGDHLELLFYMGGGR